MILSFGGLIISFFDFHFFFRIFGFWWFGCWVACLLLVDRMLIDVHIEKQHLEHFTVIFLAPQETSPLQTGTQCPENPRIPPPMPSKKRPYVGYYPPLSLNKGLMKGLFPRGGWHSLRGVPWNSYETIASAFRCMAVIFSENSNRSGTQPVRLFFRCVYWKKPTQTNSKIFNVKKWCFFFGSLMQEDELTA